MKVENFVAVLHGQVVDLPTSVRLHALCEGKVPWRDLSLRVAGDPTDAALQREQEREDSRVMDDVFLALVGLKTLLALPDEVLSFRPVAPAEAAKPTPEPAERATPAPSENPVAKTFANSLPHERGALPSGTVAGKRPW